MITGRTTPAPYLSVTRVSAWGAGAALAPALRAGRSVRTLTYVAASPGSSTLDFNAYVSSAAPGSCFYADDATIFLS